MVNPEAYYETDGVEIYPTGGGAHNWSPMSWNPATGLVYIPASYMPFLYQATEALKPAPPLMAKLPPALTVQSVLKRCDTPKATAAWSRQVPTPPVTMLLPGVTA